MGLFKLIRRDPFGAFVSLVSAGILVSLSLLAFVAIIFAVYIPNTIRETFFEKTGFYINAENIFVNILNGNVEIQNAKITSPENYPDKGFLAIESARMTVDPVSLLRARFKIYRADIKVSELKCVRISASGFNLRDFLSEIEKLASFAPKGQFRGMDIEIDKCDYIDASDRRMTMSRQAKNKIFLSFREPPEGREARLYVQEAFDRADASFIGTVLKIND